MFNIVYQFLFDHGGFLTLAGGVGWILKALYTIATNHLSHIQGSLNRIEALLQKNLENTTYIRAKVED